MNNMYTYYIYILTNEIHTVLYIGVTNNLQRRIYEHKNKIIKGFTSKYNCNKLIYLEQTNNIEEAIKREKQIKKRSRDKKERLINTINAGREEIALEL